MIIRSIKTHKITSADKSIFAILDKYLPKTLNNGTIIAVTSKIVAICEGRIVRLNKSNKDDLVKMEADYYLPREENKYNLFLTIKNNLLAVSAGIDESNADGNFILWPKNPQLSANKIREYLVRKYNTVKIGVIITDSKTTPLRWGVTGAGISHSGFLAVNDLIGTPDIFGRKLKITKVGVLDGLAASAVPAMGEGGEQTPIAVISDIPFVQFQDKNPTKKELSNLKISIDDDVYAPLLRSVHWKKGGTR